MPPINIKTLSVADLLTLHVQIKDELRARDVIRSENNLTGDLAETLFCKAFDWHQETNSTRGYDATDGKGVRYQIKGRRIHQHRRNKPRQLSAIRDINDKPFDVLAAVLFDENFRVTKAALIPIARVRKLSTFKSHTNGHNFILRDAVWNEPDVRDVTAELQAAQDELNKISAPPLTANTQK